MSKAFSFISNDMALHTRILELEQENRELKHLQPVDNGHEPGVIEAESGSESEFERFL